MILKAKNNRKLKENGRVRIVVQNNELYNSILTKFQKVKDFRLDDIEKIVNILKYQNNSNRKMHSYNTKYTNTTWRW